ncbi:MAG: type VI secretion system ImpA family N-terminal domain-containing protein [Paracoccus sp. (in: a-proteobacteria)]|uniref:type VI secretion system protein TssA n=1 Tax=Paracoccus sp. TaxID=267 RepID=UPI0026DEBA0F|nr:type VI secretion system ImpA family N-terminal domain-containing protein [Paracoccus sp. (in: a-proteobacteria)]MDO5622915.1 type VI secretion system ImpA family N-terminal domain-containing protein [Paracoccus sp. (in: a-proteobacteria)]
MTLTDLLQPVSTDEPCGPDLEASDDAAFLDYYYEAESRLPERYFIPGSSADGREDRLFDPRSVDLQSEQKQIMALLARSRDLRLVSLLARFQILAGRLADFAASVTVMADMLAQWPDLVHPGGAERRSAIEALNGQTVVVMPLMHLHLLPDSDISLRRYLVANGNAVARLSEDGLPGVDVAEALRNPGNQSALSRVQDVLTELAGALFRLQELTRNRADLGAVRQVVTDIQTMISASRPELAGWSERPSETEASPLVPDSPPAVTGSAPAHPIPDRAAAAAALDAAQGWLARIEPSSPALLLVAQARLLVGVPLVEAIEALMPDQAGSVVLKIGQGSAFSLSMDRLRQLTKASLDNANGDSPPVMPPKITDRAGLISVLLGVEQYFGRFEPASPVPLLLVRARGLLDKRFDAIVAELLVSSEGNR